MQPKQQKLITPAEYARLRGLNRSTISRQIQDGKIPTVDGMVDPRQADRARERNLNQVRRQQAERRKQQAPEARRSIAVAEPPAVEDVPPEIDYGVRSVFEALIAGSGRVPEVLCELGVRDPVALAVSAELFCDLVFALAWELTDHGYDWAGNDDRSKTPAVNMRSLAKKYGFKFDPAAVRMDFKAGRKRSAAELLIDKSDALLYPPSNAA